MDILAEARRRAFSQWLRTGRLPNWLKFGNAEFKFNPWHDPDNGRFTFAGTGRYFDRVADGTGAQLAKRPPWFLGSKRPSGGGGATEDFSNGDASGNRIRRAPKPQPQPSPHKAGQSERNPANAPDFRASLSRAIRSRTFALNWRRVRANGYDFWVDGNGDGKMIEGVLTTNHTQPRSRTAQRQAGGSDRRDDDDGGHYVARRFNGPTDAFNHFAQNSNFNRGRYRALEDELARAERAGKKVELLILPVFEGSSRRPIEINVWFWFDGKRRSAKFPNEPKEKTGAKR